MKGGGEGGQKSYTGKIPYKLRDKCFVRSRGVANEPGVVVLQRSHQGLLMTNERAAGVLVEIVELEEPGHSTF